MIEGSQGEIPSVLDQLETLQSRKQQKVERSEVQKLRQAEKRWQEYVVDPECFAYEQLNVKKLERFQKRALTALADGNGGDGTRVGVCSYHGAGKTKLGAVGVCWFFFTRPKCVIISTAPTEQQVKDLLWTEIAETISESNFKELMEQHIFTMRMEMPGFPKWFAQGRVSNRPVNIEGYHAPHILYVVDEAKGVPYNIFNAIEGALTNEDGDVRVLTISTPSLSRAGYFYDIFNSKKMDGMYRKIKVGLDESSRVSNKWREARKKEWGEDSPVYQTRVLGNFPEEAEGTLITGKMVEGALYREVPRGLPVVIGADIARFGEDKTVFFWREGHFLNSPIEYARQDTVTTTTKLRMLALRVGATVINLDDGGLGGGVTDQLRALKALHNDPWEINAVDAGAEAANPKVFRDRKTELAWMARKLFEEGKLQIPEHDTLQADLIAYKYFYNFQDKMYLESKDDMKKRIGRSPDFGDACFLCLAEDLNIKPKGSVWFYNDDSEEAEEI